MAPVPWTETRARRKGRRREGGRDGPPQRGGGRREGPGGEGPAGKGRPAPCWKVAASQPWPQSRPGGGGEQWVSGQYPVSMARWKCQNTHKAVQGTCHSVTRGQEQSLVPVVSLTSAWTPHTDHQSVRPTTPPRSPPPSPPHYADHPHCRDHPHCPDPPMLPGPPSLHRPPTMHKPRLAGPPALLRVSVYLPLGERQLSLWGGRRVPARPHRAPEGSREADLCATALSEHPSKRGERGVTPGGSFLSPT